VLRITRK